MNRPAFQNKRLSATDCESLRFHRKHNPEKAFGPVLTSAVSLTSDVTLSTRIVESDLISIWFMKPMGNNVNTN